MKSIILLSFFVVTVLSLPSKSIDDGEGKQGRIVSGENASPHQAPYMVSVQAFRSALNAYSHTCGGSILSSNFILTAAHCITEQPQPLLEPLRIVAGEHDFSVTSGNEQIRLVQYINHENYTGGVAPFDIALLIPETPLALVVGIVESIRLPSRDSVPTGNVRLFGWGSTSTTNTPSIPNILQTVVKPVLSLDLCHEVLDIHYPTGTPLHYTNVCTGPLETEVTACSGDSGGPIVQEDDEGNPLVVGIASWISHFPCGAINAVTVYVRTSAFIDWIENETGPFSN